MSVIIRLQNLPWSANALDIRNYFRGLSIPEGGVHIVGGELGDAFIAFSTDEDARQGMMLDGGKIKEIQVKLLLSSRSEMHKVIEAARQSVPLLSMPAPAPAPPVIAPPVIPPPAPAMPPAPVVQAPPALSPFTSALGNSLSFGIPGIGNPQEIPQPAVIEPPAPIISPPIITTPEDVQDKDDDRQERKRSKEKDKRRSRSRSRSRDRDRKDRKRDRRDRSRSRERRRRDRSRSRDRDRRDRKRDRKDRSRSRDRSERSSPVRRSRDRRNNDRKSPQIEPIKPFEQSEPIIAPPPPPFGNKIPNMPPMIPSLSLLQNLPINQISQIDQNRFNNDPTIADAYNKLQELGKKRNPNAFQGDQQNGGGDRIQHGGRGGGGMMGRGGGAFRRGDARSRFDNGPPQRDCCVAIRNAPNHTSYGDVRRFFPFMIDKHGIKMINDNMGRRTGNIFVRFCDPRSKHLALQRRNNELKGSEVIVEALEDEAYESAVDSFLPYRDDNCEEEITIPLPEEIPMPQFTVIKLADLPHFVKEHDIIKTFSDFSLLSIMLNDDRATRSKVAFVQFAKPEDAKRVIDQKNKYVFGKRHPTITAILDEEHEKEKALQNERISSGGSRKEGHEQREIEERELEQREMEQREIEPREMEQSETEPPKPEPVQEREPVIPRDPRQRRPPFETPQAGGAPVQQPGFFSSPFVQGQQFPAPFQATSAAPFGGFPAAGVDPRTAAANWANRPTFPSQLAPLQNNRTPDLDNEPLDCVLMKGLPREATDRTIVTFLSDTGAVPARIHLMLDGNGMPSGDCFCEFRSVQEARMAVSKHGQNLDGCRITVDLVTRSVVDEALEGPKQNDLREGILGNLPVGNAPPFFEAPRSSFAPRGGYRGRGGFDRGGYDRSGFRGGFESGRGGFDSGRVGFESGRGGYDSGRGFDRGGFEGRGYRGRGGFGDRERGGFGDRERGGRGGFERGRGRGFGRGRGGFENGRTVDVPEEPDTALEDFGAPGCVVSLENVPFRAAVDDILQFFADFELTQDDVIRRYNERGQPTGDARVAFRSPFDAQRAVKTKHMDTIYDRRISLTIL